MCNVTKKGWGGEKLYVELHFTVLHIHKTLQLRCLEAILKKMPATNNNKNTQILCY